ncbi:DUF3853 family protein [Empedobacter sp.]|uniref:DUF3853 family protein n=1 Tax=Empedobacter sp. TaxID=1927715 RepID=UPI00289E0D1B|nr:DUF3853 family protein [Empedobacter sp.]
MDWMNPNTPIWQLTVGELKELLSSISKPIITEENISDETIEYVYGLNGLAKILGCSKTHASRLKSTGLFDSAIIQNGRKIIIDKKKALELFNNNNNNTK